MIKTVLRVGAIVIAFALAIATWVYAQGVTQNEVTGNECWSAGQGPGGPSNFLCLNTVRNGQAIQLVSGSGAATTAATQANGTLMWTGAAPTTWAVTLPNPAFDGQITCLGTDTTLTTLVTVTALTTPENQTLAAAFAAQTVTVGTSTCFQFTNATLKWFKLR